MTDMRVRYAGYTQTAGRGGRIRHRVRVEGKPQIRITIPVGPEHPDFGHHYHAARLGETYTPAAPAPKAHHRSLDAMIRDYLDWIAIQVEAGAMKDATLRQRRSLMLRAVDFLSPESVRMGELDAEMPAAAMVHIRDQWGSRTAQADNCIKALRAMYAWASERGRIEVNPAVGLRKTHRNRGGTTP